MSQAVLPCGCILDPYTTGDHLYHDANCLKYRRVKMASQYLKDLLGEEEKTFIMLIPQINLGCKTGNELAAESEDGLCILQRYGELKAARSSERPPQSTPST